MGSKSSKVSNVADETGSGGGKNSGSVIDKLTEAQLDEFREAFNSFDKVRRAASVVVARLPSPATLITFTFPNSTSSPTGFCGRLHPDNVCACACVCVRARARALLRVCCRGGVVVQDGGGSIDSKELKDLMASVGQNPTDDELAEMIRIADADGTGAALALACLVPCTTQLHLLSLRTFSQSVSFSFDSTCHSPATIKMQDE